MFWLPQVGNMWELLSTSHGSITSNNNLANKPYFCLGLLANLEDLLIPAVSRSIILGIFDPFYPFQDGIPLGALDYC